MEGEEQQHVQSYQVPAQKWYAPLTRVTPLSKYLAMVLFVALPFVGFWLGVKYGTVSNHSSAEQTYTSMVDTSISTSPSPDFASSSDLFRPDLRTYTDARYGIAFEYPADFELTVASSTDGQSSRYDYKISLKASYPTYETVTITFTDSAHGDKYYKGHPKTDLCVYTDDVVIGNGVPSTYRSCGDGGSRYVTYYFETQNDRAVVFGIGTDSESSTYPSIRNTAIEPVMQSLRIVPVDTDTLQYQT